MTKHLTQTLTLSQLYFPNPNPNPNPKGSGYVEPEEMLHLCGAVCRTRVDRCRAMLVDMIEESGDPQISEEVFPNFVILAALADTHPFDFLLTLRRLLFYHPSGPFPASTYTFTRGVQGRSSAVYSDLRQEVANQRGLPLSAVARQPIVKVWQTLTPTLTLALTTPTPTATLIPNNYNFLTLTHCQGTPDQAHPRPIDSRSATVQGAGLWA